MRLHKTTNTLPDKQEGCFLMNDKRKRVILFANGEFPEPARIIASITPDDFLMAVDGGLRYFTQFNLQPNLIIGDLDSADPQLVVQFKSQGVEVQQYPIEKDETDLEIALQAGLALEPERIWVIAALGNRLDQSLANIFLLTSPNFENRDIRLLDGTQEVFLVRKSTIINGDSGDRLSLLPLNEPVTGIRTTGLNYPLDHETLYPDQSRGISNKLIADKATITIDQGLLLCIHEFSNPRERSGKND
jgi:thiamine pyrophosphokinase